MIPSFSFSSTSTAKSGNATQGGSSTGGVFSVNYGNNVSQGGAAGSGAWLAGAVVVGVLLGIVWKRFA